MVDYIIYRFTKLNAEWFACFLLVLGVTVGFHHGVPTRKDTPGKQFFSSSLL